MDDLRRLAGGASTLFNRAVQFTGEKLGTAEHTDLDAHFEQLIQRAEKTRFYTERLLKATESVLNPNLTARAEDYIHDKLEKTGLENRKKDRVSNLAQLGGTMLEASAAFGPGSSYGNALLKVGQTQQSLGDCEKTFVSRSNKEYIVPLRAFLENDIKNISREKRALEVKRLDLDAAKSKVKRARNEKGKSDSKLTPMQQEELINKAEGELRQAQSEFDRQSETTKLLLEGISSAHSHHSRCLSDLVEAQAAYYASCHQYMQDLQRQLGSNNASIVGGGVPYNPPTLTQPKVPARGGFASLRDEPLTQRARVLYDYEASCDGELSLTAEQVLTVWAMDDSDWMMAERGGQQGRVPMTYIEIIKQ